MRSVVKALGTKDSVTVEPFQSLQLDLTLPHVTSVTDALWSLTQPEHLDGFFTHRVSSSVSANSSPIKSASEATKQTLLESLPPILILHLKRFVYEPRTGSTLKVCKFVTYDCELEIGPGLCSRVQSDVVYRLVGGKCVVRIHGQWCIIMDKFLQEAITRRMFN